MKHAHSADVNIDIDTQDLEDLVDRIAASAIMVIGFYMVSDTIRATIKSALK